MTHGSKRVEGVAPEAAPTMYVAEAGMAKVIFALDAVLRGHL